MTNCTQTSFEFPVLNRKKIEAEFSGGEITSDGGVLLLRQIDKRIGLLNAVITLFLIRVIAKLEHMSQGENPRFVVTNLTDTAQYLYEKIYCACGDMENRIKEQQLGLFDDRTM